MADHVDDVKWAGLPIEDQLLDWLATPEGCEAVFKDGLDPVVVENEGIRDALTWVLDYMKEHREAPPVAILSEETGYDEFRVPQVPIAYVIGKLKDTFARSELRRVVSKIGRLSGQPTEALSYGMRELGAIQAVSASKAGNLTSDDMLTTIDRYLERQEEQGDGVSFGYKAIDSALGGLRLNELVFVLGRPKRYKSWQLLMSANAAWEDGETPVIQTMEMSSENMLDRWVCMRSGVSWSKFAHNILSAADLQKIRETHDEVTSFENRIHFLRPQPGNRNVAYLTNTAQDVGGTVMYVDQLSWFDGAKDERAWQIIGKICEQLKDASSLMPVYCAAQFNREAANLGAIADLAKIGLSDMIGQTADLLMGLYASSEMHDQNILHFGVVESRSFESVGWELKVDLNDRAEFKVMNILSPSYD